jgi:arsenite methyltransferase
LREDEVKKMVRKGYSKIARKDKQPCCGAESSKEMGYTEEELASVPKEANLGLGCGNPIALASLKEGETVLDLGSGAGLDCFLAANKVGEKGKVIGVDMTPEMIDKARENARKGRFPNVEFRIGEIENLPVADSTVDVVISNCVINLSADKRRVFQEAYRALKPGGRLMVSDIVLSKPLPEIVRKSVEAYVGCLSGAAMKKEYLSFIREAGFQSVRVVEEASFPLDLMLNDPTAKRVAEEKNMPFETLKGIANSVTSVKVSASKPRQPLHGPPQANP